MFTVNIEALRHILEGISSGFRPTPRAVLLFAVVPAAFGALLVVAYLLQRRRASRIRSRRSRETFNSVTRKQGLTQREIDTLEQLAHSRGRGSEGLHRLVTEPWVFNRATREYLAGNPGAEADVAALRFKLDFGRFDGTGTIHSTAELEQPGLRLYLRQAKGSSGCARLMAPGPRALLVKVDQKKDVPEVGRDVELFFPRHDGIYSFPSRVRRVRGSVLELEHSERVARLQRRRYVRCRVSFPVRVRPVEPTRPAVTTHLIDLGGGEATVFNPRGNLREQQRLQLEFRLPEHGHSGTTGGTKGRERLLKLRGRVVRSSRQGSRVHVEFDPIGDAQRDRILRYVLSHQSAE